MTRREEAIEKAARSDWEHTYFVPWEEATDAEKAVWLESTANVIAAYEAHMRTEFVQHAVDLTNAQVAAEWDEFTGGDFQNFLYRMRVKLPDFVRHMVIKYGGGSDA